MLTALFRDRRTVPGGFARLYAVTVLIHFGRCRGGYIRSTDGGSGLQIRGAVRIRRIALAIAASRVMHKI